VDTETVQELIERQGGSPAGRGKLLQVESKDAYKGRGNKSPDRADAFTMLVQCARIAGGIKPKSPDTIAMIENPPLHAMKDSFSLRMGDAVDFGFSAKLPKELALDKD
jgi:hypothetical protein